MVYRNGDKYEGEWINGKREGNGNITFSKDNAHERVMIQVNGRMINRLEWAF